MKQQLTIVMFGEHGVDYSTESHFAWTFEHMGHTVVRLQEGRATGEEVENAARNADVLFWSHSHGRVTPGRPMKEVLANLKSVHIPTVAYHLDLWLGLERQKDIESDEYWNIEYFFTVDKLMADWLNGQPDKPKAHFLPPGIVEKNCYIADYDPAYASDVAFLGAKSYHPEWSYRPKLLNFLETTYGSRFKRWAGDTSYGLAREERMNKVHSSSKVVVGDTLCIGFDYPYYLSDRLFNITGNGAFGIFPYIKGIEDLFEIDKEIVTYKFDDFDELRSKIDYYIAHEAERNHVRIAGYLRTKNDHTYTTRMRKIFGVLEKDGYLGT